MTNSALKNPIYVDSTGLVTGTKTPILGIGIKASADNWAVILKDTAGSIIFDQASAVTGNRGGYFPLRIDVLGITADTLTNVTNVLIYRKAAI